MITKTRALTIGKLAETAGVNFETVRYYERIGLMPAPSRTEGGHRAYSNEHVQRLSFIRRARDLGFSIDSIRALLALAAPNQYSCAEARGIALAHLTDIRRKLTDLKRLESILAATIAECSGERSVTCPVLEILDPHHS
jgi:MerR family mercuric resistance operon transcriptional regulator